MIKKLVFPALFCCVLVLSSCLDMEEKIIIKNDNTGIYSLSIDMGKMIALAEQMGEGKDANKVPEKKDSVIYFKNFVDTASALTQKEKDVLRDGSLNVHLDEAAHEMQIQFSLPFKNISQLPELRSSYLAALDKLNLSKKIKGTEDAEADAEDPTSDIGSSKGILSPTSSDMYIFKAAPGKISNAVAADKKTQNILPDSTMQMMQQMSAFMGDAHYKTVFVLPKPAKKYNGAQPQLSADKKTVTFITTLTDLMSTPALAEFNVEY